MITEQTLEKNFRNKIRGDRFVWVVETIARLHFLNSFFNANFRLLQLEWVYIKRKIAVLQLFFILTPIVVAAASVKVIVIGCLIVVSLRAPELVTDCGTWKKHFSCTIIHILRKKISSTPHSPSLSDTRARTSITRHECALIAYRKIL